MESFSKSREKPFSMGLAGPAFVHIQHQQGAERLGEAQVATVRENMALLNEYSEANPHNGDLGEWIDAWNTAEGQGAATKNDALSSIAQILVGYIDDAKSWKEQQKGPQSAH